MTLEMSLKTKRILIVGLLAVCLFMIYAGLRPMGFRFRNDVSWLGPSNGLRFGRMGIAYTKEPLERNPGAMDSLSIELVLKVPNQQNRRLTSILSLWDNHNSVVFQITQWKRTLIVSQSRKGWFRDTVADFGKEVETDKIHMVVITSRRGQGTTLYIDGLRERFTAAFSTNSGDSFDRLVLGASASGSNPWHGEVYALSIHNEAFTEDQVRQRHRQWEETRILPNSTATAASYSFDEHSGDVSHDRAGKFGDLSIPLLFHIPQKQALSLPWKDFRLNRSFAVDASMNLIGFMPFGFLFYALLWSKGSFMVAKARPLTRRRGLAVTLVAGGSISLIFELIQAYIPTRASQMSDLILNILGTLVGALAAVYFLPRIFKRSI